MENTISSDFIRGHIDTIVLSVLLQSDNYGYMISKIVNEKSEGNFELKEATLYSSIRRLEKMNFIDFYWGDESQGGRRKYYSITEEGKKFYIQMKKEWEKCKKIIDKLV